MASAHIAHDCVIGNKCVFANGALVAGHCIVEDSVTMSGNSAVHQHCRIGRLALISGVSASSMDVVPFMIYQRINIVCGVNIIGMRRAGICAASIEAVRKAYHILYLGNNMVSHSLLRLEAEMGHIPEVEEVERRADYPWLFLYVDPDNPAKDFYLEFGFEKYDEWTDPADGRLWIRMNRHIVVKG